MKAEKIAVGVLFIGSLLAIFYYAAPSIFKSVKSSESKIGALISKDPVEKYRIDLSKGKTEVEKTLIIKYNNVLELYVAANEKYRSGEGEWGDRVSADELQTLELLIFDYNEYFNTNAKNIRLSLWREIDYNMKAFSDELLNENNFKGKIKGSAGYPSDYIPSEMNIYAYNVETKEVFIHSSYNRETDNCYEIIVPDGKYYVFCGSENDIFKAWAIYTKAVVCGLSVECKDHTPILVTIQNGEIQENINPGDFYMSEEVNKKALDYIRRMGR